MTELDLEKLKYPIGKFNSPAAFTSDYISGKIEEIASFPETIFPVLDTVSPPPYSTTSGLIIPQIPVPTLEKAEISSSAPKDSKSSSSTSLTSNIQSLKVAQKG